jgi:hypothetical protein
LLGGEQAGGPEGLGGGEGRGVEEVVVAVVGVHAAGRGAKVSRWGWVLAMGTRRT